MEKEIIYLGRCKKNKLWFNVKSKCQAKYTSLKPYCLGQSIEITVKTHFNDWLLIIILIYFHFVGWVGDSFPVPGPHCTMDMQIHFVLARRLHLTYQRGCKHENMKWVCVGGGGRGRGCTVDSNNKNQRHTFRWTGNDLEWCGDNEHINKPINST